MRKRELNRGDSCRVSGLRILAFTLKIRKLIGRREREGWNLQEPVPAAER